MALQDRVQEQTNEAKNALEAYVYSLRNKMYDALSEFVTDDWKESTSKQLEQMEVWMPAECAMVGPPQVLEQAMPTMISFMVIFDFLQDWLYEEGEDETKSTYVAKLNDLRQIGELHLPLESHVLPLLH